MKQKKNQFNLTHGYSLEKRRKDLTMAKICTLKKRHVRVVTTYDNQNILCIPQKCPLSDGSKFLYSYIRDVNI